MWKTVVVVFVLVNCVLSMWHMGQCPKANDRMSFDIDKFSGEWYEVLVFNRMFQGSGKCAKGNFTIDTSNKQQMLFHHTQMDKEGKLVTSRGTLSPTTLGQRIFKYVPAKESYFSTISYRFHVIGTDYLSWAIVHMCQEGVVSYAVSGMLLTRETSDKCLNHFQKKEILNVMKGVKDWKVQQFLPNKHDSC